jgi:integrase
VPAIHAAHAKLNEIRHKFGSPQFCLPGMAEGPTVADAFPLWLKEKRWRKTGGEEWTRETVALVVKELGPRTLVSLDVDALAAYRDEGRKRFGPQSMSNRLIVLGQLLRWSAESPRKWIPFVPPMPSPKVNPDEKMVQALTKWVDEATFRAARDQLYAHQTARNGLLVELREKGLPCDAAAVRDLVERRKLYLSFAFYTGMRKHDLDELTDADVSLDMGCYWRSGRKTGVERAPEAIPRPLMRDLLTERQRLDRPYCEGELVCGGFWKNAPRVMGTAAKRAEVERHNLMDCRRSFVYHKALAGVPEAKLVELMGHVDSTMIRAIYLQLAPRVLRDEAGAAWPEALTALPGTGSARIVAFPGRSKSATP